MSAVQVGYRPLNKALRINELRKALFVLYRILLVQKSVSDTKSAFCWIVSDPQAVNCSLGGSPTLAALDAV
jgi:hypothetical protein